MNLKPYPEYKDSGVAWLGKVPKHWEMRKFRTILTPIAERNRPDLSLLSVVREKGVIERNIKDDSENHNYIPDDLSNYKVVKSGQFAMNKMKAWQGSYGISKFDGIVSPAYFVFDLKCIEPDFFHKAVRSRAYVPFFTQASDGVRVGQWDLSQTRMKEMPFFIPSPEEQLAIARFLDYKTAQIARFIKAKKRMIELLKEQKQVIINDAITGKIDVATGKPYPKYKDSGVEWLGQVPEGWEVKRGKFFFKEVDNRSFTGQEELLSVSHITGVTPRSEKNINMFKAESYIGYKICSPGQIAVNTMWAWMAAVGVSKHTGIISSSYHTYKQKDNFFNNDFLDLLLRIRPYKILYTLNSKGITSSRLRLYPDDFLNILFLCPSIKEQESILNWFKKKTINLDQAISRTEREISLMQEYRTRLISDVVTGKIDVRDIEIPDIADIDITLDESIDEPEGEEESETAEAEE